MLPSLAGLGDRREVATSVTKREHVRRLTSLRELLRALSVTGGGGASRSLSAVALAAGKEVALAALYERMTAYATTLSAAPRYVDEEEEREHAFDCLTTIQALCPHALRPDLYQWFGSHSIARLTVEHMNIYGGHNLDTVTAAFEFAAEITNSGIPVLWDLADNDIAAPLVHLLGVGGTPELRKPAAQLLQATVYVQNGFQMYSQAADLALATRPWQNLPRSYQSEPMRFNAKAIVNRDGLRVLVGLVIFDTDNTQGMQEALRTLVYMTQYLPRPWEISGEDLHASGAIRAIHALFVKSTETWVNSGYCLGQACELLQNTARRLVDVDVQWMAEHETLTKLVDLASLERLRSHGEGVFVEALKTLRLVVFATRRDLKKLLLDSSPVVSRMTENLNHCPVPYHRSLAVVVLNKLAEGNEDAQRVIGAEPHLLPTLVGYFTDGRDAPRFDQRVSPDYQKLLFDLSNVRTNLDAIVALATATDAARRYFEEFLDAMSLRLDQEFYLKGLARLAGHGKLYNHFAKKFAHTEPVPGQVPNVAMQELLGTGVLQNWETLHNAALNSSTLSVSAAIAYLVKMQVAADEDSMKAKDYGYEYGEWTAAKQQDLEIAHKHRYGQRVVALDEKEAEAASAAELAEGKDKLRKINARDDAFTFTQAQEEEYAMRKQWMRDMDAIRDKYRDNAFWKPVLEHMLTTTGELLTQPHHGNILYEKSIRVRPEDMDESSQSQSDTDIFGRTPGDAKRQRFAAAVAMRRFALLNEKHLFCNA